ncbi:uncharacterized protein K444DRAFT_630531 [Hyaloscypha bicolor E]|uniref:Uncharacterized protein n=1 Tax=Hyaloscypha bicolor E TaxID=1095630 RepID=A0A2J6T778_9HELO|nr:uncharacterized protein K444DRAFT_630531 [Hyaloscypha bicolor E]PMD58867.1 hypothetical protein K444DRAFT_630531 [Hyaloscypha bicolor E]
MTLVQLQLISLLEAKIKDTCNHTTETKRLLLYAFHNASPEQKSKLERNLKELQDLLILYEIISDIPELAKKYGKEKINAGIAGWINDYNTSKTEFDPTESLPRLYCYGVIKEKRFQIVYLRRIYNPPKSHYPLSSQVLKYYRAQKLYNNRRIWLSLIIMTLISQARVG